MVKVSSILWILYLFFSIFKTFRQPAVSLSHLNAESRQQPQFKFTGWLRWLGVWLLVSAWVMISGSWDPALLELHAGHGACLRFSLSLALYIPQPAHAHTHSLYKRKKKLLSGCHISSSLKIWVCSQVKFIHFQRDWHWWAIESRSSCLVQKVIEIITHTCNPQLFFWLNSCTSFLN